MSNVINLLEKLGQDSALTDSVARTLAFSEVSPEIAAALAEGDQDQLAALLDAGTNVSCLVFPAKPDGEEDEEKRKDDQEEPDDETEKGLARELRRAAIAS